MSLLSAVRRLIVAQSGGVAPQMNLNPDELREFQALNRVVSQIATALNRICLRMPHRDRVLTQSIHKTLDLALKRRDQYKARIQGAKTCHV